MLYVEPLIELDEPYWKIGWLNVVCKNLITTLSKCETKYEIIVMANESLISKADFDANFIEFSQSELLSPFKTTNYLKVSSAWHNNSFTQEQILSYEKLMKSKLKEFIPDIVISFTPVPFFKNIFPKTLILYHELSLFSRKPYPKTYFLDPVGVCSYSFLNQFAEKISNLSLNKNQKDMILNLKRQINNIIEETCPFKTLLSSLRTRYEYLIFVPLQFSKYYAFDDVCSFKSQFEFCMYVLEKIPKNIGVIFNSHPEHPAISSDASCYLRSKYSNYIYDEIFNSVYSSGQYIIPYVDAVVTVSSTIGLQTILFDKKLVTLSNRTYSFLADCIGLDNIEQVLKSKYKSKDSFLYYMITRYCIEDSYYSDSNWLDSFLQRSLAKFLSNKFDFDFFEKIDDDYNIFCKYQSLLTCNSKIVPVYLESYSNYVQLYFCVNGIYSEENSIKYHFSKKCNFIDKYFDVSYTEKYEEIRLDPCNSKCHIKKITVELIDGSGNLMKQLDISNSNADFFSDEGYIFLSNDPQFYLQFNFDKSLLNNSKIHVMIELYSNNSIDVDYLVNKLLIEKNALSKELQIIKNQYGEKYT